MHVVCLFNNINLGLIFLKRVYLLLELTRLKSVVGTNTTPTLGWARSVPQQ